MTTVSEVLEEISSVLHAYTGVKEQMTYLTGELTSTDVSFPVHNSDRVSQGLAEVGDELVLVDDSQDGAVSLFPFGRAQQGSTAQDWPTNTPVVDDPLFPKVAILRDLQQIIDQLHPELFAVSTTSITFSPATFAYELPADVDRVLSVSFDIPGPSGVWPKARTWRTIKNANTTAFPSGKAIEVFEAITPGRQFHVVYAGPFGQIASTSDTLDGLGVPASVRDVLVYGVCYRMTQALEASRLHMYSIPQMARQEAVPAGAITNLSRQWYALFTQRKMEERKKLLDLNPLQIHRTR